MATQTNPERGQPPVSGPARVPSCFVQGIRKPLPNVKQKLEELSSSTLSNFEEFQRKGDKNAAEIFNILHRRSAHKISRATIWGGKGYRNLQETSPDPDFNLVIFVIDQMPPFDTGLAEFEKVLKLFGRPHNVVFQSKSPHSIQFRMRDLSTPTKVSYISFELFPAMNLLSLEEEELPREVMEGIQTEQTLKCICEKSDPRANINLYNSSLAERYVSFVEGQSSFVHQVIRLAKLWERKVTWSGGEILYGRSMIIELIAISVSIFEEVDASNDESEPSLSEAFQIFLKKLIRFDKSVFELFRCPANLKLKLPDPYEKYVEETCALGGPVILDPVNPFNNLAVNFTVEMKMAFKLHAKCTLHAIQNYREYSSGKFFNFDGYFGL